MIRLLILFIFILHSWYISAEPFRIIGARASGMGGAFVAVADGVMASYWNPANLSGTSRLGITVPFYNEIMAIGDFVKELDDIDITRYNKIINEISTRSMGGSSIGTENTQGFFKLLAEADDLNKEGLGFSISTGISAYFRMKHYGLSVIKDIHLVASPEIDLTRINMGTTTDTQQEYTVDEAKDAIFALVGEGKDEDFLQDSIEERISKNLMNLTWGTQTFISEAQADALVMMAKEAGLSMDEVERYTMLIGTIAANIGISSQETTVEESSYKNNQSAIEIRGIDIRSVIFTYAKVFPEYNIKAGVNLKFLYGNIGYYKKCLFEDIDIEDEVKDGLDRYVKTLASISMDIGLLYEMDKFKVGFVAKNLNKLRFTYPEKAEHKYYKIRPQMRVGIMYSPISSVIIACDMDITKNDTILPGYYSQMVCMGIEWTGMFNMLSLRCGMMRNITDRSIGNIWTAGLGIRCPCVYGELAATISGKRTRIKGIDIPVEVAVSMQVGCRF